MDLSNSGNSARQADLIITAGQDSKVKVWNLAEMLSLDHSQAAESTSRQQGCYHEFNEHTAAVTCVKFSFGASL